MRENTGKSPKVRVALRERLHATLQNRRPASGGKPSFIVLDSCSELRSQH